MPKCVSMLSISFQMIVPSESKVELLGTKVEIKLKKKSPFGWKDLEYKSNDSAS